MNTTHDTNKMKEKYKGMATYKTSDLALAAVMILKGKDLLYMEPYNVLKNRRNDIFQFIFEDSDDMETIVRQYSTNDVNLNVIPNAFRSTMKYLKEQTRNQG